jgi:predicted Zn-dependent peptidase
VDVEVTQVRNLNAQFVSAVIVAVSLAASSSRAQNRIQPRVAPPASTTTQVIVKRQLSNGLSVWITERHELPVVQMSLLVPSGSAADPRGRYGVASLTAAMLTKGAGTRSAVEIADSLDTLVANLSASSDIDSTSLQLYVPVARLGEALPLMADVAQRPTFPPQALDDLRQQRLITLRNARSDPDAIAALAFARGSYGTLHRSAAPLVGTTEGLQALTAEDLRAFHAAAYRPGGSTLIVVGDVSPDLVLPLLETHFGKWRAAGVSTVVEPAPVSRTMTRQVILVDMPGAPQSRIVVGGVGGSNSYAQFFPMQVLAGIVRDRLSSDRNPVLRDFTTGVRSGFDMRKSATPFVVSWAAQMDKTAESLRVVLSELGGMVKVVPPDELARAKDDVAIRFPKTFEVPGRISSRLRALEALLVFGLPDDYYANYGSAIQAVAPSDIQGVAQQYIDPSRLTIAIVGDRRDVEPSIRALNLGSIKEITIDEVFGPAK